MQFFLRTDKSFLRRIASLSLAVCWLMAAPAHAAFNTSLEAKPPLPNEPKVPNISFVDLRGAPFKFNEISGKLRIIHYWATWCGPCIKELPYLDRTQAQYERYGLKVVAISLDTQGPSLVKDFFSLHNITHLEPYIAQDNRDARRIGISGVPASIFVDAKGFEITRANGPVDWESDSVQQTLRNLLGLK